VTLTAIEPEVYPWFDYRGFTFCLGLSDGDAAWTSGQSASVLDRESGRMLIEGGLTEQAERSYMKLLAVLAEAGLQPSDVAHITENVTAAGIGDYALAAAVRERIFGTQRPTITTVVVDRLVRSKALIELELHGVPGGGQQFGADAVQGTLSPSPVRESHGEVHLPTIIPVDEHGAVIAAGDPIAQYAACLDLARVALAQAGLSPAHVVACHEYLTNAAVGQVDAFADSRRLAFGDDTVGGGVVMQRLHLEDVTVAIDLTASLAPKQILDPGWGATDAGWPAIRVGDTLFCSAISTGKGDLEHQAIFVYDRLLELLAFAGLTPANLRSTIEFCTADMIGDYKAVATVRAARLTPPWPASTGDLCTRFATAGAVLQTVAIANF
jgi:enamine deaminase RidA (YjgF/YER057c/UK114 family)